jgi:hypothetical protein
MAQYTAPSYAIRETIPIMEMLKEIKALGFPEASNTPTIKGTMSQEGR